MFHRIVTLEPMVMNILTRQAPACPQLSCPSLTTKPWWFVCGGARSRREKIQLKSCWGVVGEKKFKKIFLSGTHWRGVTPNFSLPGPVSSRQNEQIPCHDKENVFIILRRESRREKIWFFDLRNSRHAPNRPGDLSHQMVFRGKKCRVLWHTKKSKS